MTPEEEEAEAERILRDARAGQRIPWAKRRWAMAVRNRRLARQRDE